MFALVKCFFHYNFRIKIAISKIIPMVTKGLKKANIQVKRPLIRRDCNTILVVKVLKVKG